MPSYLHSHHLSTRFQALDQFLIEHQQLWKPRPFTTLRLDWETTHPELATHLRQCSLADAETDSAADACPPRSHNWPSKPNSSPPSAASRKPTCPPPPTAWTSQSPAANGSRSKPSPATWPSTTSPATGWTGAPAKATSAAACCNPASS